MSTPSASLVPGTALACVGRPVRQGCARTYDPPTPCIGDALMALFRRALLALGVAGVIAAVLRLRGSGGSPPQQGGWRELSGPDLE